MQFFATEAATKSLHPYLTSEAVPVFSFFHPELKLSADMAAIVFSDSDCLYFRDHPALRLPVMKRELLRVAEFACG